MSEERAFMREAQREERATVDAAVKLWSEERNRLARRSGHGYLRYIDKPSLARLRLATKRALAAAYDWRDIERGIRDHVTDVEASPAYADRWAGEACASREDREQSERASRLAHEANLTVRTRGLRRVL